MQPAIIKGEAIKIDIEWTYIFLWKLKLIEEKIITIDELLSTSVSIRIKGNASCKEIIISNRTQSVLATRNQISTTSSMIKIE